MIKIDGTKNNVYFNKDFQRSILAYEINSYSYLAYIVYVCVYREGFVF